jgi:transglutaminase-like putative cysteine protease
VPGDPFAGLITDGADRLPLVLAPHLRVSLSHYLVAVDHPKIEAWARKLMDSVGRDALAFLSGLCSDIHARIGSIGRIRRMEPGVQPAVTTFETRRGTCRDLALLFIEGCRSVGIPARFVSGYQRLGDDTAQHDLHAWAEVYLPGLGWRGYDASQGLAVVEDHVALAASALPENAAPVVGAYRGKADSSIEYRIHIETGELSLPQTAERIRNRAAPSRP